MNLQDLNSSLPKPWLNIQANAINSDSHTSNETDTYKIGVIDDVSLVPEFNITSSNRILQLKNFSGATQLSVSENTFTRLEHDLQVVGTSNLEGDLFVTGDTTNVGNVTHGLVTPYTFPLDASTANNNDCLVYDSLSTPNIKFSSPTTFMLSFGGLMSTYPKYANVHGESSSVTLGAPAVQNQFILPVGGILKHMSCNTTSGINSTLAIYKNGLSAYSVTLLANESVIHPNLSFIGGDTIRIYCSGGTEAGASTFSPYFSS